MTNRKRQIGDCIFTVMVLQSVFVLNLLLQYQFRTQTMTPMIFVLGVFLVSWQMLVMWGIGGVLIYLAIAKQMEPTLLLPMGFGAILVNLPVAIEGTGVQHVLQTLFSIGIEGAELFPLMLFIGIGAMIDFQPLLTNPKLMIFGAAAQFGIFFTLAAASLLGFDIRDAASIAIIGAAGISAFLMSARVVHKMGLEEDNSNFLLMHSIGVNVSGQIASVIAGGLILALVKAMIGG